METTFEYSSTLAPLTSIELDVVIHFSSLYTEASMFVIDSNAGIPYGDGISWSTYIICGRSCGQLMKYNDFGCIALTNIRAVTRVTCDDLPPRWNFLSVIICELSNIPITKRLDDNVLIVLSVICLIGQMDSNPLNSVLLDVVIPKNKGIFDSPMDREYSPAALIIAHQVRLTLFLIRNAMKNKYRA